MKSSKHIFSNCTPTLLTMTKLLSKFLLCSLVSIVGRICNNFEKNRAFYDKSMKLGTWLVDNKTKK